ncbi:hypothetical protein BJF85_01705 [Saccharomonospora sp. CUA-673]|uniref:hypothetical protein n=1 Tax=Saccharomonospora sp. CUA-673 TaxID=1904969 RepID=UPI000959760B|nr:hypothetical protein [Saccharomonospora sp. CUA-673]OLT45153.1 hypothetical protein BJF85_01705 [Saccharomonospora sp. CUA-673]
MFGFGRRRRGDARAEEFGYRDNAALDGVGGYEPADPNDAYRPATPVQPEPAQQPAPQHPTPQYPGQQYPGQQPSPQHQAGWQPPGQSYPAYPQQPSSAPTADTQGKAARPVAAGCFVVLAVLGGFVAGLVGYSGDDDTADTADSAGGPDVTATPDTESAPNTESTPAPDVEPVVDGWQPVVQTEGVYAYDVPPDWEPAPTRVHGWSPSGEDEGRALSTSAFAGQRCDGVHTNGAGVTSFEVAAAVQDSTDDVATALVDDIAGRAYGDNGTAPHVDISGRGADSFGSDRSMTLAVADVQPEASGPCVPDRSRVAVAVVGEAGETEMGALVVYGDAARLTDEQLDQMLRSLRHLS